MTNSPQGLVERLRAYANEPAKESGMVPLHPNTVREAADRIEALEAAIHHYINAVNARDRGSAYEKLERIAARKVGTHD